MTHNINAQLVGALVAEHVSTRHFWKQDAQALALRLLIRVSRGIPRRRVNLPRHHSSPRCCLLNLQQVCF